MDKDIIQNRLETPTLNQILDYMNDYSKNNYLKLAEFLESTYKAKPVIMYSSCSAMPGWNVKYKKSGKSLCTIYPHKEFFTMLLVLREIDIAKIKQDNYVYSDYFMNIIENSGSLNGCKWLMIGVDDENIIEDIKSAMKLKI